jgi:ribosomal protein S18
MNKDYIGAGSNLLVLSLISKNDMYGYEIIKNLQIMSRRLTGNSKNFQEMVEKAIKRARHMALVPYIVDTKNITDTAYARSFY